MESLSQYPRNLKGIALLLLRLLVAGLFLLDAQGNGLFSAPSVPTIFISAISIGLTIGLFTLTCGIAGFVEEIILLFSGRISPSGHSVVSLILCLVVAILGAGAYSLDGVLFGRRRVVL